MQVHVNWKLSAQNKIYKRLPIKVVQFFSHFFEYPFFLLRFEKTHKPMKRILSILVSIFLTTSAFAQMVALDFDGVNDQVVVTGNSILCPTKITLETWMYAKNFNSSPCADCAPIIWHQGKGYRFGTGNTGGVNIQLFDGSSTITLTSGATLSKNAWHHLAMTYDSSMIRIYIDGALTDSLAKTFTLSYSSKGADVWIVDPATGYGGTLEETRIWNYARSFKEIREGMVKSYKSGTKGLMLQLSYDEGVPYKNNTSITTLKDGSGNSNKSTLASFKLQDSTSNFVLGRSYCDTIAYAKIKLSKCSKYVLPSKKRTVTKSGIYQDTIKSWRGCDSVMTINLTINQPTSSGTKVTACDSFVNPINGAVYRKSGTYKVTIFNKAGCDSSIAYFVTIGYKDTNFIYYDACVQAKLTNGTTVTKSGTYVDKFQTYLGCDSFDFHVVTIRQPSTAKRTLKLCKFIICPTNSSKVFKKPGVYYDTIKNVAGCDSAIEYTVNSASTYGTLNTTACNSFKSPSGKYTYTTSGTYYDTLFSQNKAGCDSFITINLKMSTATKISLSPVACRSYKVPSGVQVITSSKTVKDYIKGYKGCDSIEYTINVTINNANVGTTRSVNTLSATTTNASATFQWLDCNNSMAKIAGATNKDFTPSQDGKYAISVTENSCTDTSACINFAVNGLNEIPIHLLKLTPNPSNGAFVLNSLTPLHDVHITLINIHGQMGQSWLIPELKVQDFHVQVSAGVWYVKITAKEGQQVLPLVFE